MVRKKLPEAGNEANMALIQQPSVMLELKKQT